MIHFLTNETFLQDCEWLKKANIQSCVNIKYIKLHYVYIYEVHFLGYSYLR